MSWKFISGGTAFFDLDDPRFTAPMSVISGLASGLCERKAAVDNIFNVASWGANLTDATQKANVQSATVSNVAANIVRTQNIGVTSTYTAANGAAMVAPDHWTQPGTQLTKTYMDYFDNELMSLANKYVTAGGVAYAGFQDFAEHASVRAYADEGSGYGGYIAGGTATSGGSSYTSGFLPAFNASWAAERRDMLEELRYVKTDGDVTGLTYDGKNISLGGIRKNITDNSGVYARYPAIDSAIFVLKPDDLWYGWTTGTGQSTINVYTEGESPGDGSLIVNATPNIYTRYETGDDTANNQYAWRNTNASPATVYTSTSYYFYDDDEIQPVSSLAAGTYTSCGRVGDCSGRTMDITREVEVTGFTYREAGDANYKTCWTSGTSSVWTSYAPDNTDPGDRVYDAPDGEQIGNVVTYETNPYTISFTSDAIITGYTRYAAADDLSCDCYGWSSGTAVVWVGYDSNLAPGDNVYSDTGNTSVGRVAALRVDVISAYMDRSYIQHNYTYDYSYETNAMTIRTAAGTFARNMSADANGLYAWTSGTTTVFTAGMPAWTGEETTNGAVIIGTSIGIPVYGTVMTTACDAQHAANVVDAPVTSETGRVICDWWGLQYYGREAKSITPSAWLTTADPNAATQTVMLPAAGTVTVSKFSYSDSSFDSVTCPIYAMVDCRQTKPLTDALPYEVRIAAGYTISSGAIVQALSMAGNGIGGKTVKVSMFLGMPRVDHDGNFFSSYINDASVKVSALKSIQTADATTLNNAGGTLIVSSGGTAKISGCKVNTVIVEPKGSLVLATEDAKVGNCCVLTGLSGGTVVSGIVESANVTATGADKIESYFVDFTSVCTSNDANAIVTGNQTYTNNAKPADSNVIIKPGAHCTFNGMNWDSCSVRVSSGGSCTLTNGALVYGLILMPGATATISSSTIAGSGAIHSGAVCHMSGWADVEQGNYYRAGIRSPRIYSGATMNMNEYTSLGDWNMAGSIWEVMFETGAVVHLTSNGTLVQSPKYIYEWKAATTSPPRSYVYTFFNHGLTVNNTALHQGWNVIEVAIPAGATSVDLATGTGAAASIPPVREVIYMGVIGDEFYGNYDAGTSQIAGFSLCTIKVEGLDLGDNYPLFTYRKFGDSHK